MKATTAVIRTLVTAEMDTPIKILKTTMGDVEIDTPRDREGSFDPQLIPKRTKDVSGVEDKVLFMYAKGKSQRDISDTIEDIYGFEISQRNHFKYHRSGYRNGK